MTKKIFSISLLAMACVVAFFSCKKATPKTDLTLNYFPIQLGKTITYEVDSIYYNSALCTRYEVKSQLKYTVTDSFVDNSSWQPKTAYIVTIFHRPYDGATWTPSRTALVYPSKDSIIYAQNNVEYVKLKFPITEGQVWKGNSRINTKNPSLAYLNDWNYLTRDVSKSYNNGLVNFDNTVTVIETDQSVNYPSYDSLVDAHRTFSKAVYAYNVGMIYHEITYWTYKPNRLQCKNGYTVIMQALDHN